MTSYTIAEIAASLGADAQGDLSLKIEGAAEPALASPTDLALAMSPAYGEKLSDGAARAAILWQGADWQALGLAAAIFPRRPRYAMAGLTAALDPGQGYPTGFHPSAVIDPTAQIGADVTVGPLAVIGPRARIGAGAVVGPLCHVGADTTLGAGALLRENASIGARCTIGDRFIAQPGARVGGDGFSYVTPEESAVERARGSLGDQGEINAQSYVRIHSLGAVTIGDDVEIGSNAAIDNGTIRDTVIGDRSKLDNLAHIAHNVELGPDCLICGQVGIAGSVKVGRNVVMGGQCGVSDNITIGDNVILGGGSGVLSNVPAGRVMLGYPATKMDSQVESYKALRRLPRVLRDVAALQKAVFKRDAND
ncbi:UDP-3-O-(3-hydroxymyristoyl)glucosamine N-acyltransferase [Thalassococcus sp. S3]|uniref:UDP-3-O-(3-hydroxymyristoyl)glucosamine N-acyltransferase n=1 Tax=Thalassococcus sp. S3 TaxID=2017482 RepID=UPI0010247513|nr:UDP-3-O-(3-hydroxymyristoyl)glucosamine N-acyltransferase [Thalassococcus sp. S3]QBF31863.1 UDP-3-O-(3-hydroxymyristoyl)glucosamine N-acyltransferase [Thalassococcus sp. S3]